MKKDRLLIYFIVLLLGLIISFLVTKTRFDIKTISLLFFFLIFIPTLLNPDIGLIVIIVSMLFSPEVIIGETIRREISIRIEDIFLLVILLAWFMRITLTKDIASIFRIRLTPLFFSYIAVCVISTVLSVIFSGEINIKHSFFSTLKYLEYYFLFLMVRDNMRSLRQSKIFVAIFLLTALMVAIHSNVFIEEQQRMGTTFFRTAPPVETRGGGEAGTLGGYLVLMIAVAGGLLLYARSIPIRIFLVLLELLMFRSFLYSLSRGSYIAIIPTVMALIYFSPKGRPLLTFVVVSILISTVVFMPQMIKDRIATTVATHEDAEGIHVEWEESPQFRIESWKFVLFERFPKSPIFGHGVGKFFIDSQLFSTLTEVGLAGLILFLWVLVTLFKMARDIFNMDLVKNDHFSHGLTLGFLGGFVGLLAHAISTNTFIIIRIMEPFWFIAAIVLSLPKLLMQEKEASEKEIIL